VARKKVFNAEALKDNIMDLKERLVELEEDLKENVKEKVAETEKKIEHQVEEHPVQSVGIAFGAGLAIGALSVALMRKR
jgi:ElaB/YqjD/DUF883 family membrane-anchored ribosome-binding protein